MLGSNSTLLQAFGVGALSSLVLVGLALGAVVAATPLAGAITEADGLTYALVWLGALFAQVPLVFALHRSVLSVLSAKLMTTLSREVESMVRCEPDIVDCTDGSLLETVRDALVAVPKAALIGLFVLGLNFVPVIGQIAAVAVALLLSARDNAREGLSVVMARRGLSDDAVAAELKRHPVMWWVAGAVTTGLSFVPLVNALALPASVAGATVRLSKEPQWPA